MPIITDPRIPNRFEALHDRRRDGLVVRLLAPSLDRKLAAGYSPESHRLLAIRARTLVAPATRRALAQTLEEAVERARLPRQPGDRRIPLCDDRIMAAEFDLRDMISWLRVPLPLPARGVAMVTMLLRDGTGPLYNHNCTTDLRSLVRHAVAELDPSRDLGLSA